MQILLIEDDNLLGKATRLGLMAEGFEVDWKESAQAGLQALESNRYDCVLLDLGLPDINGHEVLHTLRVANNWTPVIVVTAHEDISERIKSLDGGADDFILKPFKLAELALRVETVVKRARQKLDLNMTHGNLNIKPNHKLVELDGKEVNLTSKEFKVLLALLNASGKVLSRSQLEGCIYGAGEEVDSNSLEVHIHHLRKKLGKAVIETVHGMGYRMGRAA